MKCSLVSGALNWTDEQCTLDEQFYKAMNVLTPWMNIEHFDSFVYTMMDSKKKPWLK